MSMSQWETFTLNNQFLAIEWYRSTKTTKHWKKNKRTEWQNDPTLPQEKNTYKLLWCTGELTVVLLGKANQNATIA